MDALRDGETNTDLDGLYRWHAFYGSHELHDTGSAIAGDPVDGAVLMAGGSADWNGPDGEDPLNAWPGGDPSVFVLKLDADGGYLWHTFYGGEGIGVADSIALGVDGDIYVAGIAFDSWSGPNGESPLVPHPCPGGPATVVLHLEADGSYGWHAFFGSVDINPDFSDLPPTIRTVAGGDVVVVGQSMQWNGPGGEAPLRAYSENGNLWTDTFALRLGPDGVYRWHTFHPFRSGKSDVDDDGGIYITGNSNSWNGPDGESPLNDSPTAMADENFVVMKLHTDGTFAWHTFYGPCTISLDIACGRSGVFVAGSGYVDWHGPIGEAPLHETSDGWAGVVLALDADGGYRWHAFYGPAGAGGAIAHSISADRLGNLVVGMASYDPWNGPDGEPPLTPYAGAWDSTVLSIQEDGAYDWHAFFGSSGGDDDVWGLSYAGGALYAVGRSSESWDGPGGEAPLREFEAETGVWEFEYNAFVLKLVP